LPLAGVSARRNKGMTCASSESCWSAAAKRRDSEMTNAETSDIHPQQAIRRFDVFAEYTRQERQEKGYPEDEAKR
jgi:hypothetical protein